MKGSFLTGLRLALALLLAFAAPALAQLQGGNLTGAVLDEQGAVLPGVTVTVRGVDATQTTTTDENGQFRFLNLAPGPYTITAALQGFATVVREQIIVAVGKNVDLPIALKVAAVEETVTVTGDSPVVDVKATGTATNFTSDELTRIPTSRDPFALMRSVPGVLVDRVNIGGNETGQQSNFVSKGTRPADAVWTMDGVNITDMTAVGASPTYFNYDNFEEIQVSTAGQSIKQPTGGVGLNMVVKRGTNQFHGGVRGYFTSDELEASNVPAELESAGVTPETADHNKQISDYGYDIGGPIFRDRAWFYHSYSVQDVRLVRRAGQLIDRTVLKNPNVKVNWQATTSDMVSFLYFDGAKVKDGRSPGITGILFDAPTATWHQDGAYADNPFHGLWKIADDRVIGPNMFLSAKYAYYNTGFVLDPVGGLDQQAGRSFLTAQSFGSVNQSLNIRPQKTVNVDVTKFLNVARWHARSGLRRRLPHGRRDQRDALAGQWHPRAGELGDRSARAGLSSGARPRSGELPGLLHRRHLLDEPDDGRRRASDTTGSGARRCRARPRRTRRFRTLVPGIDFAGYDVALHVEQRLSASGYHAGARRGAAHGGAREHQPVRRSAQHRNHRLQKPQRGRRVGDLSLDRSERRSFRTGQ